MKRIATLLVGLVFAFLLIGTGGTAWACSCVRSSAPGHLKSAEVVFIGTVTATEQNGNTSRGSFAVEEVYKGEAAATVFVDTGVQPANCFAFLPGTRYVVFAKGDLAVGLTAPSCSGTTDDLAVAAAADLTPDRALEQFDPQAITGPLSEDGPGQAPARGVALSALIAAGILAGAATVGTVVAGRRGNPRVTPSDQ